jgi:hypothetical protein
MSRKLVITFDLLLFCFAAYAALKKEWTEALIWTCAHVALTFRLYLLRKGGSR